MSTTEWKPLYKVGDKVRVIDRIHGHEFEIDEEVTIDQVYREDKDYRCSNSERDFWWLTEEEVEPISKN